jgi:5-hydroxyisourate hydrolase-like protein (transthyretin family)
MRSTSRAGVLDHPVVRSASVEAGAHAVLSHLGEFFADDAGSLGVVPFHFRISDVEEHLHPSFKFTRWAIDCFAARVSWSGGATGR